MFWVGNNSWCHTDPFGALVAACFSGGSGCGARLQALWGGEGAASVSWSFYILDTFSQSESRNHMKSPSESPRRHTHGDHAEAADADWSRRAGSTTRTRGCFWNLVGRSCGLTRRPPWFFGARGACGLGLGFWGLGAKTARERGVISSTELRSGERVQRALRGPTRETLGLRGTQTTRHRMTLRVTSLQFHRARCCLSVLMAEPAQVRPPASPGRQITGGTFF